MEEKQLSFINPNLWGPTIWKNIDMLIAGLPEILSENINQSIFFLYSSLKELLPCNSCKKSYNEFILENDTNIENIKTMKTKNEIIEFNYKLRNKVNNKLQKNYFITLDYYKLKLNFLLCSETNIYDYTFLKLKEFPFIPEDYAEKCYKYMEENSIYKREKTMNLISCLKNFINNIKEEDINENNKMFKLWIDRNKKCEKIYAKLLEFQTKENIAFNELCEKNKCAVAELFYYGCFPFNAFEINMIEFLK